VDLKFEIGGLRLKTRGVTRFFIKKQQSKVTRGSVGDNKPAGKAFI
jgi:hypothetical protein